MSSCGILHVPYVKKLDKDCSRVETRTCQPDNQDIRTTLSSRWILHCNNSFAWDILARNSPSHVSMEKDLSAEAYHDAIQTFEAVHEISQRLSKWAMKELADPYFSLPLLDLAQYCETTIKQCKAYLDRQKPLPQPEFVRQLFWRGLGALGFDPDADSDKHKTLILDPLLAECKRRTSEVLELLDERLAQVSGKEDPFGRRNSPTANPNQLTTCDRFFTAVKAVHENNLARSESEYMLERQSRTEKEVETHLLPQIFAFGN
jgi:hypothetical protein